MTAPEIRPATARDFVAFYGAPPATTVRAYVADLDGDILGIAGISFHGSLLIAFSDIKPEMRKFPITIMRGARKVLDMTRAPILAYPDPDIEGAPRLLERLGFVNLDGTVYRHG